MAVSSKFTESDITSEFAKDGVRYGWSYTDFDKMLNKYNLSKLPDYDNAAEPYIAHILMSAPSLNVAGGTMSSSDNFSRSNLNALKENAMTSAFVNDKYGNSLLMALSEYSSNRWLPIVTTKAMSYTVTDFELKTVEKGNTFFGHVIKYAKHSEDHKISSTMSIDFRNDRYLSILKMMYIWMSYMYLVSKTGTIVPTLYNQINAILDYGASLYYLITRRDGRELVYWEKLVGVFPIRVPLSIFSSSDNFIIEDRIQIDFAYGIRSDPCDPSILMDINALSGNSFVNIERKMAKTNGKALADSLYLENRRESPFVKGDVFASRPYIKMVKSNGSLKYYLTYEE